MANIKKRLSVLVTSSEKSQIKKRAKEAGLSLTEFIRVAAKDYVPAEETEEIMILNFMIDEMNKATERAEKAIGETIQYVDASNRRISKLEEEHKLVT